MQVTGSRPDQKIHDRKHVISHPEVINSSVILAKISNIDNNHCQTLSHNALHELSTEASEENFADKNINDSKLNNKKFSERGEGLTDKINSVKSELNEIRNNQIKLPENFVLKDHKEVKNPAEMHPANVDKNNVTTVKGDDVALFRDQLKK